MKKILSLILTIILLALCAAGVCLAEFCIGYTVHRNVQYGEKSQNVMDIFIPDRASEDIPNGCVLFIHGGSWTGGDKREEEPRCRHIANQGYIAATINYSLSQAGEEYSVFTVLDEIDKALETIKNFTAQQGIFIDQAAVSGYSAGAHLSMLYAYSRKGETPLKIKFTANMVGPSDINPQIWGMEKAKTIATRLSGKTITDEMIANGEFDKILHDISPVSYVTADTPPSIFIYAGKDTMVPPQNGESIKNAFERVGASYEYILLPDADHLLLKNLFKRYNYGKTLTSYCKTYFS